MELEPGQGVGVGSVWTRQSLFRHSRMRPPEETLAFLMGTNSRKGTEEKDGTCPWGGHRVPRQETSHVGERLYKRRANWSYSLGAH